MFQTTLKFATYCLLALTLSGVSTAQAQAQAQETQPKAEAKQKAESKPGKPGATPFNGKLKALDKTAKTITLGERTFLITAETKIIKDGKPATLDDGVVGEKVAGAYLKGSDGKLTATTVRFGAKPEVAEEKVTNKEKKQAAMEN